MKQLLLALLFCFSTGLLFGQSVSSGTPLMMPYEQNQEWASTLKALDKGDQWAMISERFFEFEAVGETLEKEELYVPFLIIDGIAPHVATLSMSTRSKVRDIIRDDGIKEVLVVDKEPETWYANKVFAGIVLITLNNRKTSKKLLKLLTK
ncbi:hypothetical protein [Pontibacter flavimaris]|uniref:Uncharacterized protein n=1 Tax=Pontibacter flavimaris TaxID=1797110 RepID=A0A1Q5PAF8_9BACT|nr:hypothetical protein [Pontibacter flavimaris]OKL39197.1 hypothetical protein A3841_04445 [Pontibacter flavimaris]